MARFSGIPTVPQSNVDEATAQLLNAMKQNLELLTGSRGEVDGASKALLRGTVTVSTVANPQLQSVSPRGAGFTIGGAQVPAYTDYIALLADFQRLANDVNAMRETLNALIGQLKQ
jgi:hypothetical protein